MDILKKYVQGCNHSGPFGAAYFGLTLSSFLMLVTSLERQYTVNLRHTIVS
jgi:hypothetical protein